MSLRSLEQSRFIATFMESPLVCETTKSLVITVFFLELQAVRDFIFRITKKSLRRSNQLLILLSLSSPIDKEVNLLLMVVPRNAIFNIVSSRKLPNSSQLALLRVTFLTLAVWALVETLFVFSRPPFVIPSRKVLPDSEIGDAWWVTMIETRHQIVDTSKAQWMPFSLRLTKH